MSLRSFNSGLLLAIALTVAATLLHSHLPTKHLRLIPGNQPVTFIYSNHQPGEPNHGYWIDQDAHHMRCLVRDPDIYLVCSFNLLLTETPDQGIDLSRYSRLILKVSYSGPETRLRLYMRQFDPRFSIETDLNSSKFHFVTLRIQDFQPEVIVGLDEFKVADWWVGQYDVPRSLARRDLSNVVSLGLDFEGQMQRGEHDLTIDYLEFAGDWISAEHWYQGIIGLWMLAASLYLLHRQIQLYRQTQTDQQRISELDGRNRRLQSERETLHKLSTTDALTGILNRHGLTLARESLGDRLAGSALILMDVDHFKRINDRRGHDAGDRILHNLAQLVQQHVRERDYLGRWGGEEFVLLCPDTNAERGMALAEKLRNLISSQSFEPDKPLTITASFGVAIIDAGENFDTAFKRADQALYHAKHQGRNCVILAGNA